MSTDAAAADAKKFYTLSLTITDLDVREGRNGPYALLTTQHTPTSGANAGQEQTLRAFCGGKAYTALRDDLVVDGTIRVTGHFEKASDPSEAQRFRIIGRPRAEAASLGATMLVNGLSVPVSEFEALQALFKDCPDIEHALTQPIGEPVRATAQNPYVVAGRAVPYEQDRQFRSLLGRCPSLRRALHN
jgi:hypothetical protein